LESFANLLTLITDIEYLFAKFKFIQRGEVGYFWNWFMVSSPPQIILASAFIDNSEEISSDFSYLIRQILL
jgi:hypothetical protein